MRVTPFGSPFLASTVKASEHTPEQRREVYEKFWQVGGFNIVIDTYCDLFTDQFANETLAEFVRDKIRSTVKNPDTARKLLPNYLIGTKRQILDEGYYDTYNRDNVTLVDLREDPILEFYPGGVRTKSGDHPIDMLVLATACAAHTPRAPLAEHTHCEVHPSLQLGVAAATIPFSGHNQAPRTSYFASMCKQTAGTPPPSDGSLVAPQLLTLVSALGSQAAPVAGVLWSCLICHFSLEF
jgi:cation diffusion facilitator CzcD-associated flavoprotein CzcO